MLSTKDTTHIPFGIAPTRENPPGVLSLYFRTGIGEMAPIGEIAPGGPKIKKEILF